MARGIFSLWELVRRADFENSARWCVVSELGAIRFLVVWGDSRGFVPINRGPGPFVDTFHSASSLPSASKNAS